MILRPVRERHIYFIRHFYQFFFSLAVISYYNSIYEPSNPGPYGL
jgi:hypothetical protein